METHHKAFLWMLGVIADRGLLKGRTVGVDATTLEANAAMRSIMRRDNGASYNEEPKRGRRKWAGKKAEQKAVYGNRRRVKAVTENGT
ncbi:MAG: hypothetical protein M3Z85_02740 [Acidobacteriota bacterium]|nr:hypothetical protein [Acidobacteriota bacterium]